MSARPSGHQADGMTSTPLYVEDKSLNGYDPLTSESLDDGAAPILSAHELAMEAAAARLASPSASRARAVMWAWGLMRLRGCT